MIRVACFVQSSADLDADPPAWSSLPLAGVFPPLSLPVANCASTHPHLAIVGEALVIDPGVPFLADLDLQKLDRAEVKTWLPVGASPDEGYSSSGHEIRVLVVVGHQISWGESSVNWSNERQNHVVI